MYRTHAAGLHRCFITHESLFFAMFVLRTITLFFFLFLYIVVKTGNGKGCRWNCTDTRLYRRVFVSISWRTIEQTISHTILAIFVSPFTNFVVFLLHLSRQTVIARRSWLTVSSFSREFLWNYWDWLVFFGVANISILLEQREREREREKECA